MKYIHQWFRWAFGGGRIDEERLDAACYNLFNSPDGKNLMAYLIETYMMEIPYKIGGPSSDAVFGVGMKVPVSDMLTRIDNHMNRNNLEEGE